MAVPAPKTWTNGDDFDGATLNTEWRDAFRWLLHYDAPAFTGRHGALGLTFTNDTPIPILTEELKRGNITHTTNSTRVTVNEGGFYVLNVEIVGNFAGITSGGLVVTPKILVNGVNVAESDNSRRGGSVSGGSHQVTRQLTAGSYVEMAFSMTTYTGSIVSMSGLDTACRLDVIWRSKA